MTKFLNNADIKGYIAQTAVTSYLLKADSTGRLVAAIAGTDYQAPTTALLPSGGTAGQILAKIDGTNYNAQWIDNFAQQIKYDVKLGAALSKGTPVYVSSANGTNIIVSASSNATEATSSKTLGLLETGGALNDIVKVVSDGLLSGLNTSTATIGDPVWLGVNGALIFGLANKPSAPAHLVYIGAVTRVHATNGEIFIKVQNGFELDELHNVALSSVADGQGLFYESATSLWKNKTIASVLGYTPANDSTVVHLAGTETITGVKTFSSVINASTLSLNGGTLAGNNIVSMRSNPTGGQFRIEKSDGSLSAYPFYIGADGTALAYYYNAAGALKVLLHTNGTSYFGNSLSVGYSTYAATSYSLDVNGSAQITSTLQVGGNLYGVGATFSNAVTAASIIKSGGTSSQFLKADGSVDSNAYITSSSLSAYLPLTGGTISGDLTISSTNPRLYFTDTDNNPDYFISNTDGTFTVYDVTNSVGRFKIYSGGNAELSGALVGTTATFSSTAGNQIVAYYGVSDYLNIQHNGLTTKNNQMNLGTNLSSTPTMALVGTSVGIGTVSPSSLPSGGGGIFSVYQSAAASLWLGGNTFSLDGQGTARDLYFYFRWSSSAIFQTDSYYKFLINSTEIVRLQATGQLRLNAYTTSSSFSGTAAGYLAFDSSGNVITVAGVSATDNTKLPLAGGTMTGILAFSNVTGNKIDFYHDTTGSGDRYGVQVQNSELRIHSGAGGTSTGGITFGKSTTTTFTENLRITNDGNIIIGGGSGTGQSQLSSGLTAIRFPNQYSSGYTDAGVKLYIFNSGTTIQGFTAGPAYDLQYHSSGSDSGRHAFYVANSEIIRFNKASVVASGQLSINNGASNALSITTAVADGTTRDGIYLYENSGQASGRQAISWYNGGQSYYKARIWTEVGSSYAATQFGIDVANDARVVATRLYIRNGDVYINNSAYANGNRLVENAGTWSINVTGSSGTATSASRLETGNNQWTWSTGAHTATNPNTITLWDQYSSLGGAGNPVTYGTIVDIYGRSGHEHDQILMDSGGTMYHRNCFYGTNSWNGWRTMLDSSNYNSYSPTLTGGGASGTWGINVTGSSRSLLFSGDSAKAFLDGLWAGGGSYPGYQFTGGNSRFGFSSTSGVVDVYADGNFYATDSSYLVLHTGNYNSYAPTLTGGGASGTWGISISGNAASASAVAWSNVSSKPAGWLDTTNLIIDNVPGSTVGYIPSGFYQNYAGDGNPTGTWFNYINVRHSNPGNNHGFQIGMSYYDNNLWFRSYQGGGSAQAWARALSTQNYNSYSPTLTGGGASGTWGINITGNANNITQYTINQSLGTGNGPTFATIYINDWARIRYESGVYFESYDAGLRSAYQASFGQVATYGTARSGHGGYIIVNNYITNLMQDTSGNFGFFSNNDWAWRLFYNRGNNCWGIGTDNTYSGDGFRCIKYGSAEYGWTTWSDRRAKENISTINGALDKVLGMRGVYYNYIKDETKSQHVGFIAQELMEILPQSVRYAEEIDEYNINYGPIVSVLSEAIKEQNIEIQSLKAQLQTLLN